jgi:hypothetical protein
VSIRDLIDEESTRSAGKRRADSRCQSDEAPGVWEQRAHLSHCRTGEREDEESRERDCQRSDILCDTSKEDRYAHANIIE